MASCANLCSRTVEMAMAAEHVDVRNTFIPDHACMVGCKSSWGLGNQLFVFAGRNKTETDNPSEYAPIEPYIHEVHWGNDLHGPITRKLVNETHNVFLKLQKCVPQKSESVQKPLLVKFSREYRSVIKACLMDLQTELKRCIDADDPRKGEIEAQLQLFDMTELVWSLAEILFIDVQPSGSVLGQLLEWLRWHFVGGDHLAKKAIEHDPPQEHESYWDAVFCFILQGRVEESRKMLSRHTHASTDAYITMDTLLRKMPLFALFNGQSLAEFDMKWRHWQDECMMERNSGIFTVDKNLQTICRVLCGEDQVLLELKDLCGNWYCMLVTCLLYHSPSVKAIDVQYHAQFCINAYGGNAQLQPWDHLLLATLEFDFHQVLKEASSSCGSWWFVAHLADLLHHRGLLESQTLCFGSNLREFLLLEYATSLMSHHSLWQVATDYFDHCPELGRAYLEQFVDHLPLETEKKAYKVLQLCEHRSMTEQVRSICKVLGMRALKNSRLGLALSWALRSKDIAFITFLAEKFLTEYSDSGDFSHMDLIDHLGSDMLLSPNLTFLGKYREFHRLYEVGDFAAAASILLSLLTAKLAPKKFWMTLLMDALPLLEAENVIFNAQQTYELIHCLEEIGVRKRVDDVITNDKTSDLKLHSRKTSSVKMQIEGEKDKISLMRLALARNLARAILLEGSVTA